MNLINCCFYPDRYILYYRSTITRIIYYFTKIFPVKYFIGACLCISLFSECSSTGTPAAKDSTTVVVPQSTSVQGLYKGDFDGSPIYININYSSGKHIAGYNVHKGLRRNLSGTIQQAANGWELQLSEPGDHVFDGKFKLVFDAGFATAKGKWNPLNTPSLKEKLFTLSRVEQIETDSYEEFTPDITYSSDHADISFDKDGICLFHYYDKITDSTFVEQLTTVRGTWEKKDSGIIVNWQKNEHWDKTNSTFNIHYAESNNGRTSMTSITGEGYEFYMPF